MNSSLDQVVDWTFCKNISHSKIMKFLNMNGKVLLFLILIREKRSQVPDEHVLMTHGIVLERTDEFLRRDKR